MLTSLKYILAFTLWALFVATGLWLEESLRVSFPAEWRKTLVQACSEHKECKAVSFTNRDLSRDLVKRLEVKVQGSTKALEHIKSKAEGGLPERLIGKLVITKG